MKVSVLERMWLFLLAVAVVLAAAANAQAGQFHVYSCRTPSGQSAPTDGWSGSVPSGAVDAYAKDTCGEGGALIAALGDQTNHLANINRATWELSIPEHEKAVATTLWRAGYVHGRTSENATYQFWLAGQKEASVFDECSYSSECPGLGDVGQPFASTNFVTVPGANLGNHIFVRALCLSGFPTHECQSGYGDANGYAAAVYLYAADITLEQEGGPSASGVGGELAGAPAVSGMSDVSFNATDPGAGVYEAVFTVDGQVVRSTVVDENGGRCKNVGQTSDGSSAFLYLQPCPASVSAEIGLDTTKLSNGPHHLFLSVIDPAGNSATVLDRQITVDNPLASGVPGPANGSNASAQATLAVSWAGAKKERLTSRYGRAHTIVGRLTAPGGAPIAGAQIGLQAVAAYAGARAASMASPTTAADGSFTVALRGKLSSRTLRFSYRSHLGDARPATTRALSLSVRAAVALRVVPHTTSVGNNIFFNGRLLGAPIPTEGKQLVLEARSPGGPWIEFDVVRSDARGRFSASYRFKFPGPAHYQFRARSEPESDYPFAAGASNVVDVHEL
jgi:hypothetical protein